MIFLLPSKIYLAYTMQQNLASRSNKYNNYFFLINFPRLSGAVAPIFCVSECSLGIGESAFWVRLSRFSRFCLFRKFTNPERGISLGHSTRYATFALRMRLYHERVDVPGIFLRCLNHSLITGCPRNIVNLSNFTWQIIGKFLNISLTESDYVISANDDISINPRPQYHLNLKWKFFRRLYNLFLDNI